MASATAHASSTPETKADAGQHILRTPTNKFDYVTRLVTQHEQQVTQQSIQISELTRKTADMEQKQAAGLTMLAAMKDRNILHELDGLRQGLTMATQTIEGVQQKIQEQELGPKGTIQLALLQGEVDQLKKRLLEMVEIQQCIQAGLHNTIADAIQGAKSGMMAALREEMTALTADIRNEVATIRSESSAAASGAETATLTTNSLAMKFRAHVQANATALENLTAKVDSNSNSLASTNSRIEQAEQDAKKVRKHVVRLERHVEGLQALGHVAVAADKALSTIKKDNEEAMASLRQIRTDSEEATATARTLHQRVGSLEGQMWGVSQLATTTYNDLSAMAESLGNAFKQVCEASKRAAVSAVSTQPSYLSSLLAPMPAPSTNLLSLLGRQQQQQQQAVGSTWNECHDAPPQSQQQTFEETDFHRFLKGFKARTRQASSVSAFTLSSYTAPIPSKHGDAMSNSSFRLRTAEQPCFV